MSYFFRCALVFSIIIVSIAIPISKAESTLPPSLSEHLAVGIDVAMDLISRDKTDSQKSEVRVFIKNTSTDKMLLVDGEVDHGVKIYYIGEQNVPVPLHPQRSQDDLELYQSTLKMKDVVLISDNVLIRTVKLTSDESKLVKKYSVYCAFSINDVTLNKTYDLKSSPKMLFIGP